MAWLTPHSLPPAFEDGTDTGFRNVCELQFDAGEIPKEHFQQRNNIHKVLNNREAAVDENIIGDIMIIVIIPNMKLFSNESVQNTST